MSLTYWATQLANVTTKEEADALVEARVADMMSWSCWCVGPPRAEVERIVRGEFVYLTSWQKDRAKTELAERLFGYVLADCLKDDSVVPGFISGSPRA